MQSVVYPYITILLLMFLSMAHSLGLWSDVCRPVSMHIKEISHLFNRSALHVYLHVCN